jgi:hypothetical protein
MRHDLSKQSGFSAKSDRLLAHDNEGIPFDKDKLSDITSLGLRKNPQDAIGNKGLGFKSVFQVSESPKI